MAINDVFSKRNRDLPDVFVAGPLPPQFCQQMVFLVEDMAVVRSQPTTGRLNGDGEYYNKVLRAIKVEHGVATFLKGPSKHDGFDGSRPKSEFNAILMGDVRLEIKLDLLEMAVRMCTVTRMKETFIEELNHRFREHGLGYEYHRESKMLISKLNEFVHQEGVRPALQILTGNQFANANSEFLSAFEDYKSGDFPDCLVKCGAAFESVMKVICSEKGWQFTDRDTASPLLKTIISSASLPTYLEQPLTLIATIRNRASSAHGAGNVTRNADEYLARYALNATASAVVLLHEATR